MRTSKPSINLRLFFGISSSLRLEKLHSIPERFAVSEGFEDIREGAQHCGIYQNSILQCVYVFVSSEQSWDIQFPACCTESEMKTLPIQPFKTAPSIEFHNVKLRYQPELPQVLSGFSLVVQPGCKVALCGRTGAGKSSVLNALLRMVEVDEGMITIDEKSSTEISPQDMRSLFTTIPQV